jgi:exopolysaccharide production protein ExoZ
VVLQHGIYFACAAKGVGFMQYLPIGFGQVGVGIFFVISGYVMTMCLPQGAMFMPQRIARIYPAFWAAIAVSSLAIPMIGHEWHFDFYSTTLLPASAFNEYYAVPYWTLVYEMVFYAIMYVMILCRLSRRHIAIALALWAAVIAIACQTGIHAFPDDVSAMVAGKWIFISPANFEFIAGALYGLVGREVLKTANPLTMAIQALVLFIIAQTLAPMAYYVRYALWGISFMLVLHLVQGMRAPRVLERAGDYSYGLYLVQSIFCQVGAYCMARFFPTASVFAFIAVTIATALVVGFSFGALEFAFHAKLVKPALRLLSPLAALKPAQPDSAGVGR